MTATEKSVALIESMHGRMDQPCPVCRGGWWYEQGELAFAVHAHGCPWADAKERDIFAAFRETVQP